MLEVYEISMCAVVIAINCCSLAFLLILFCSHYIKAMPNPAMRIATIAWLAGLGLMGFGVLAFANYSLFINELNYSDDWRIGMFARSFLLYGAFLFRFSVFGAVFERGYATFMMKHYTKSITRSIIMVAFLIICPILQLIAYYCFSLTKMKLTGMINFIDTCSLGICLLIRYFNSKLRRRRMSIELSLAERYQVNENIRFLHVILPSALANWVYGLCLASTYLLDSMGVLIPYNTRMLATHMGYTILVVISLFIPSIIDGTLLQKLCFAQAFKERLFTVIVHPSRNVINKPDTDVYFNGYQKSWK